MLTSYPTLAIFSNSVAACPPHNTKPGDLPPSSWHGPTVSRTPPPKGKPIETSAVAPVMLILQPKQRVQDPEDDFRALLHNDEKLRRCGFYHGSLSWVDASNMLKKCQVGTFMIRDSEHSHYLYALSVQTKKGPTSCRLDYDRGSFRLDSAEHLVDKMPRFQCVTDLVEHYVEMTENLSLKNSKGMSPVWLDLDEENTRDAPVQICKPLYKRVPDLQLLCCQSIVRRLKKRYCSVNLTRTIVQADSEYKSLPTILKNSLNEYLFPTHYL